MFVEVAIYLKAAENIVRFEEWYHANSGKWALQTLDQGWSGRSKPRAARGSGEAPGSGSCGRIVRAIDRSIQPVCSLSTPRYGKDPKKKWRLDIVLHGRDSLIDRSEVYRHA